MQDKVPGTTPEKSHFLDVSRKGNQTSREPLGSTVVSDESDCDYHNVWVSG